jgi:hypothetical protein
MAYELRFPDGGRGFIVRLFGTLTSEDIRQSNDEIFFSRDLAAEPFYYGLVDAGDITETGFTTEDIKDLAERHIAAARRMPDTVLVMCVYVRENVIFGTSRMWQTMAEQTGWETNIAREREKAVAWLIERVAARSGVHVTLE